MLRQCIWALGVLIVGQASLWTREIKYGKSQDAKKRILSYSLNRGVSLMLAASMFLAVGNKPAIENLYEYFIVIAIFTLVVGFLLGVLNYAYTYWSQMKKVF